MDRMYDGHGYGSASESEETLYEKGNDENDDEARRNVS